MEIKQATQYHLVEILFLLRECILDMNTLGLKHWNNAFPGPESIRTDIENGSLYFITELGIARGMINLTEEIPDEYKEINWTQNPSRVMYVNKFAVHPLWKQTDIPDQLLSFAEKKAKQDGFNGIRLDVLDSYPVDPSFFKGKNYGHAGEFHSAFQKIPYTCYEKNL
jgi:GNAT superfamily N-acetyltransferase